MKAINLRNTLKSKSFYRLSVIKIMHKQQNRIPHIFYKFSTSSTKIVLNFDQYLINKNTEKHNCNFYKRLYFSLKLYQDIRKMMLYNYSTVSRKPQKKTKLRKKLNSHGTNTVKKHIHRNFYRLSIIKIMHKQQNRTPNIF